MAQGVRVRIQCDATRRLGGVPQVEALLTCLRREQAAAVAVLSAGGGFGLTSAEGDGGHLVVMEWVDDAGHVAWAWPRVAPLLDGAVVTREEVELITPLPAGLRRRRLDVEVGEVMRGAPICIDAALPVAEVRRTMALAGVETAPVLDAQGALCGLIRTEDLRRRVDGPLDTAAQAMSSTLATATAEARLREVVILLLQCGLAEIPVVDEGRPVGLVGLCDALRLLAPDASGERQVGEPADPALRLRALLPGL